MSASSIELGSASHRKTIESDAQAPPHPPPLPPTHSGALRGAAPAGALRPSAQSAPRQTNAIIEAQRPTVTHRAARRPPRRGRPARPDKLGRIPTPSHADSAQGAQRAPGAEGAELRLGRSKRSPRSIDRARRSASACAREHVGERACVMKCGGGEGRERKKKTAQAAPQGSALLGRRAGCGTTPFSLQARQAQVGYDLDLRRSPGAQTVRPEPKLRRPAEPWPWKKQERREPGRPNLPPIPRGKRQRAIGKGQGNGKNGTRESRGNVQAIRARQS